MTEMEEAKRESWLTLQVVCLLVAFVDPVFAPVMSQLPGVPSDPVWSRFAIAAFALLVLAAAAVAPVVRARADLALVVVLTALHIVTSFQVVSSGNHPFYVSAALLAVFGSQLAIARVSHLVGVLGAGLAALVGFAAASGHLATFNDAAAVTVLANGALVAGVMGVLRIRIQDREKAARRELAAQSVALAAAESRAREAQAAAEDANQAKSGFLANMSHELRTPLNAILGYTELLRDVAADDGLPHFDSDLQRIHGAGTHLLSLINDVLDLAKVEAGRLELHPDEFRLAGLVDDVASLARPLVERNGNVLIVEGDAAFEVLLDRTKLRQILLNLISNAAKFTQRGTITVRTTRDRDRFRIEVADTGLGMDASQLARLFEPFVQVHSAHDKFGGTGLGLVLCKRLAGAMHGDVGVQSRVGRGTTFTLDLPAIA